MSFTLFLHEIKRNKISLLVWSFALAFTLGICVIIYPQMQTQMNDISQMFSDMGAFSEAFGMDQLNFGEFIGYFGVECGNTLGIGGALLAGIVGVNALCKEERDRTSEFLLTFPVSRTRIVTEKLLFSIFHITVVNLSVAFVCVLATFAVNIEVEIGTMLLILFAYYLMQLEIMAITFGISAFLSKGGLGIGIVLAFGMYFMSIVANLMDELEFVKYMTPFGFADSGHIISEGNLEPISLAIGAVLCALGIFLAYYQYNRKDIK